jgi:ribulose-phosphate 3-epimerase
MKNKQLIAPSILSADFKNLEKEIKKFENAKADLLHLDIMDGHFVPNITIGPMIVKAIRNISFLPIDSHLMIENPEKYIDEFVKAGSNFISFHIEVIKNPVLLINRIKNLKTKAGIALNPQTHINKIKNLLDKIDFVLIMSVNPGFGGQSFIQDTLEKIKNLAFFREKQNLNFQIEVDGGIKLENIKEISNAGCDIFVSGTGITGTKNYKNTIYKMKKIISL